MMKKIKQWFTYQFCSHKHLEIDQKHEEKLEFLARVRPGFPILSIMRCKRCKRTITLERTGVSSGYNLRDHFELNFPLYLIGAVVFFIPMITCPTANSMYAWWFMGGIMLFLVWLISKMY